MPKRTSLPSMLPPAWSALGGGIDAERRKSGIARCFGPVADADADQEQHAP